LRQRRFWNACQAVTPDPAIMLHALVNSDAHLC